MPHFTLKDLEYRPATVNDAAALATMNWQLIRDEGHRNRMSMAELESRMGEWLSGEYAAILFEEAGQSVGYALYRRDPDYIYLRQFFVQPQFRRQGVGQSAMRWLREHAWDGGRVRVEVLVNNTTGISFWRSVGFVDYCLTLEWD